MARRTVPPGRPTFEPPWYGTPPSGPAGRAGPPPSGPPPSGPPEPPAGPGAGGPVPERRGSDPLRGLATLFATVAAIGVAALAVWLPVREAQDEAIKHYPSTGYVDVAHGATRTWHDTQWRMVSISRIPWKYYTGASPPPARFARMKIVLHARLVGKMAKAGPMRASDYLDYSLTKPSFQYEVRDADERAWDPISAAADSRQWCCGRYRPAKGLDVTIYVDVPPEELNEVMPVVKFEDHKDDFNFKKTPSPREVVLRFRR